MATSQPLYSQFVQFPAGSNHAAIVIGKGGACLKSLSTEFRGVRIAIPTESQVLPQDKSKFPFIYIGGADAKMVHEATIRVFELVMTSMTRERFNLLSENAKIEKLEEDIQYKDLKIFEQKEQIADLKISAGVESDDEEEEETGITMGGGSSTTLSYGE